MKLKPRSRCNVAVLAVGLGATMVLGVGTITARAQVASAAASTVAEDPAKDALAYYTSFPQLWNEQRWDEVMHFYADDAIVAPPNHELIRGNEAIVAFYKTVRPLFGEMTTGLQPHSVIKSGDLTTIMGNYDFKGVRVTSTEVFQRQADGRYRSKQETFGLRDPLP